MRRGRFLLMFWRLLNPLMRPLAGLTPWWVLVETKGRKTGKRRLTPLAVGRRTTDAMWVVAVRGRRSAWVMNAEAMPAVRYRHMLRWQEATLHLHDWQPDRVADVSAYARSGAIMAGQDPLLVEFRLRR